MSVAGVGNEFRHLRLAALGLALLLAGCAGSAPWPFNAKPAVFRAPEPPQVLGRSELPRCPQALIAQAQWLARNMARVRLGYNKLQVVSSLGDPANAETFSLTNGAVVEVLFYHTPETICRVNARGEGLMPLVFQDDRLLGYGPNYYKGFIVPMMRPTATQTSMNGPVGANGGVNEGLPQQRVSLTPGPNLRPAPARTGRLVQEDLPRREATPPASIYAPTPVTDYGNGYSTPMNQPISHSSGAYYGTSYTDGMDMPRAELGRGEPLR